MEGGRAREIYRRQFCVRDARWVARQDGGVRIGKVHGRLSNEPAHQYSNGGANRSDHVAKI